MTNPNKPVEEELKISLLKRITGRQDPTSQRVFASIIIGILFFFLVFFSGFFLNKALIPYTANAVFNPFIKDGYIPIDITNGLRDLRGAKLSIQTCYMDDYKELEIPDLIPNQATTLLFRDKETLFALDKIYNNPDFKCDKRNISTTAQCWIKTYIIDGKLYAPSQECKNYRCGECNYTILIQSKKINKEVKGSFPPLELVRYNLQVFPLEEIENFDEKNSTFFELIGVSVYTARDLCILNDEPNCEELYDKMPASDDLKLEISPANHSLGNLTLRLRYIQ